MTRKRFTKLLMAQGYSRNEVNRLIAVIRHLMGDRKTAK